MADKFIMGAELTMQDNFKSPMSAATKVTEEFKRTAAVASQTVTSLSSGMGATKQAAQSFADTLQGTTATIESMAAPTAQATQGVNRWKAAMQQFNRGAETLKNVPVTLKQIAAGRLDGLETSFIKTRLQVGLLVGGIQAVARSKLTGAVSSFREFKQTVTEGKTGLSGFATGLKNIGKINIANTYNSLKGMTSSIKDFAKTKITGLVNKFGEFKTRVTGGETGVKGLVVALKKAAGVGFTALHTGISKIGSLAASAGSKVANGLGGGIKLATKGIGIAVGAAATALGGLAVGAINIGKSFEAGMSTVAAISGATGTDLQILEDKAKQMGATTVFSATESAKAMEYMAMAGWKTDQMVGGIAGIMDLAAASGEDLASTSDIVTDALTAFGMKAEDSGRFADVLASASSNANTNVSMMGATFRYVAPVAGALGYSIEDMGLAIGIMANAGIKGEMAGTQLRATLSRMAKPTKETQEAMDALGLSLTNGDGSMKSFEDVMVDMRKGFGGLTKDQQASYAAMLGGQEAMSGLLAIANASETDFNKLASAIDNSAGSASKMAAIKLDNLQGDIEYFKGEVETLGIDIYQSMQEPLRGVTQMATEMVGGLSTAFKNGGFSGLASEVGNTLATVVTKIAGQVPTIVSMGVGLVKSFVQGIAKNAPQIAQGAATAVVTFASGVIDLLPQIILTGTSLLVGFVQGIAKQLPTLVPQAVAAIETIVSGLMSNMDALILAGLDIVNGLIAGVVQNLPLILGAAMRLIQSVVTGLVNNIQLIINCALSLVSALVTGLIQNIPMLLQGALQLVMGIVNGLVSNIQLIIDGALSLVNALVLGIVQNLPTIIQAAVQVVIALAIGLIQAIPQLIAAVPQLVMGIIDTILHTNWLQVGIDIVSGIGKGLFDGIKGLFGGGGKEGGEAIAAGTAAGLNSNVGSITAASQTTANAVTAGLRPDYSAISGYGATATAGLATGLATGAGTLGSAATTMGTDAMTNLSTSFTAATPIAVAAATQTGTQTVTGLSTGITDGMGLATDASTSVVTGVTDTFNGIDLYSCGTNAMEGFNNGLIAMRATIMQTASGIANSVKSTINGALQIHSPSRVMEESGEFTGEGLVVGITKMIDRVKSAAQGLSDSAVEPFATRSTTAGAINPSGVAHAAPGRREGLKIAIENIILQNVGEKDPKALVAEILKMLYAELSGADEVLNDGEMGALLT